MKVNLYMKHDSVISEKVFECIHLFLHRRNFCEKGNIAKNYPNAEITPTWKKFRVNSSFYKIKIHFVHAVFT